MPTMTPLPVAPRLPLSDEQRRYLGERLLQERRLVLRALARAGRRVDDGADVPNRVPDHMADIGSDTMQENLDAALATRETRTLGEIDAALRRLYRQPERFGLDERTGEPIAFERLDIIPWARGDAA